MRVHVRKQQLDIQDEIFDYELSKKHFLNCNNIVITKEFNIAHILGRVDKFICDDKNKSIEADITLTEEGKEFFNDSRTIALGAIITHTQCINSKGMSYACKPTHLGIIDKDKEIKYCE